jgi:hypothetical protein
MRRASRSFLLSLSVRVMRLLLKPFRGISSPTTPTRHLCQYVLGASARTRCTIQYKKNTSGISPLYNLYNRSHRARMRLCFIPMSKSRFRLSHNTEYTAHSAAGSIGRTRQICPKGGLRRRPVLRSVTILQALTDNRFRVMIWLSQCSDFTSISCPLQVRVRFILILARFGAAAALLLSSPEKPRRCQGVFGQTLPWSAYCVMSDPAITLPAVCTKDTQRLRSCYSERFETTVSSMFDMDNSHDSLTSATSAPTCRASITVPQTFSCGQD